jgi:hypothetical protein
MRASTDHDAVALPERCRVDDHTSADFAGWPALLPLFTAALVVFAWLPALNAPYQYDDFNTPVADAASQSLSSWWHLLPRTLRPLTKLTYALESSVGAHGAASRRIFNALLFGGCMASLSGLLRATGTSRMLALLLVCLWAVHPVHGETLVALAGRPVLLSLFLILASSLFLLRAHPRLALLFAVLALLARESALPWLVACAALVAHDRGVATKRIVATSAAAFGVGALILLGSSGLRALVASAFGAADGWNRLGLQWAALTKGTLMLFTDPMAFTPVIDFAPRGAVRLMLILTTLALYVAALWVVFAKKHRRELRLFALLWLCIVIPTHSVVPKLDVLTARPFSASLAPLLALAVAGLAPRLSRAPRVRIGVALASMGGILVLLPLTRSRAALYTDPVALWRDAAERSTHSVRPLINLGTLLARNGRLREAEATLVLALERDPTRYDTRLRLNTVRRALRANAQPNGE